MQARPRFHAMLGSHSLYVRLDLQGDGPRYGPNARTLHPRELESGPDPDEPTHHAEEDGPHRKPSRAPERWNEAADRGSHSQSEHDQESRIHLVPRIRLMGAL